MPNEENWAAGIPPFFSDEDDYENEEEDEEEASILPVAGRAALCAAEARHCKNLLPRPLRHPLPSSVEEDEEKDYAGGKAVFKPLLRG